MSTKGKNLSSFNLEDIPYSEDCVIGLIVSEWNGEITENLAKGAVEALIKCGVSEQHLIRINVPGSFELPMGAQFLLETMEVDAVVCLGCVIRGETSHFDYVCNATSLGIKDVALKYNKPVIFGVLTDDHIDQSRARSGGALGNKGVESAISALKMVAVQKQLHR